MAWPRLLGARFGSVVSRHSTIRIHRVESTEFVMRLRERARFGSVVFRHSTIRIHNVESTEFVTRLKERAAFFGSVVSRHSTVWWQRRVRRMRKGGVGWREGWREGWLRRGRREAGTGT